MKSFNTSMLCLPHVAKTFVKFPLYGNNDVILHGNAAESWQLLSMHVANSIHAHQCTIHKHITTLTTFNVLSKFIYNYTYCTDSVQGEYKL